MKDFENRLNKLEKGFGKLPDFDAMARDIWFAFMGVMNSVPIEDPKIKKHLTKKKLKKKFILSFDPFFEHIKECVRRAHYR
ncbi:MAG: hypothetical protein C4522_12585 [Desulfobacteraceae bacterium]|nr:MAG: hypothetical protein C4522_12585 [Desulfobacteraceae bacterium]